MYNMVIQHLYTLWSDNCLPQIVEPASPTIIESQILLWNPMSIYLSIYLSVCLSVYHLSIHLSNLFLFHSPVVLHLWNTDRNTGTCTEYYKRKHALAGVAQWIERGLQTKGSLVRFPVRALAWSRWCVKGNHTLMFLSLSLFLSPFPSL